MPPRRQAVLPDKICKHCGGAVKQRSYADQRYKGGIRLEPRSMFKKREFCSQSCAASARWEKKRQSAPTPTQAQDDNKVAALSPPTQAAEPAPRKADEPLSETLARAIDRHPELLEMLELVCR